MNRILVYLASLLLLVSCQNAGTPAGEKSETAAADTTKKIEWNGYTKIKAMEIDDNAIRLISQDWMLITAGSPESFNTMTASWGALGEVWSKPVAMITVRQSRYTYQFLTSNEYYTLSFFDENYKSKLLLLGSKSGRDTDKVKESGLTPMATPSGSMAFAEAKMILECRKLYSAPLAKENFADQDIFEKVYTGEDTALHDLFIGQIVNVWVK